MPVVCSPLPKKQNTSLLYMDCVCTIWMVLFINQETFSVASRNIQLVLIQCFNPSIKHKWTINFLSLCALGKLLYFTAVAEIFVSHHTGPILFSENDELTSRFTLTTAHSSDFCCKIRMDNNQEKDVTLFIQGDDVGYNQFVLRKPKWTNMPNSKILIALSINTALKKIIKGQYWTEQYQVFLGWTSKGTRDNLRILLHFPNAILSQCHLSLWKL